MTLPHEVSGNKDSKNILVFMHGFPDTMRLWDNIIPQLEKDNYIVNISYPNFHASQKTKWGIEFDDLLQRIKETIDEVNDTKRAITVVSHDWGAIFTYWFDRKYPSYLKQMITMDVPHRSDPSIIFLMYSFVLSVAFFLGCLCGNVITRVLVSKLFKYNPPYFKEINAQWNYFYVGIWKALLKAKFNPKKMPGWGYEPTTVPLVYLYGKNKPFHFHSKKYLERLAQLPNCEWHEVNANHWVSRGDPDFVIKKIRQRIVWADQDKAK